MSSCDTDLLSDRMWVQVQDFFGQRVPQPWADNGALVVNALDNLSGTDALISVRSRGRFSRRSSCRAPAARGRDELPAEGGRSAAPRRYRAVNSPPLQQGADPEKAVELTPEQRSHGAPVHAEKRITGDAVRLVQTPNIDALGPELVNIAWFIVWLTIGVLGWLWRRRPARGGIAGTSRLNTLIISGAGGGAGRNLRLAQHQPTPPPATGAGRRTALVVCILVCPTVPYGYRVLASRAHRSLRSRRPRPIRPNHSGVVEAHSRGEESMASIRASWRNGAWRGAGATLKLRD